MCQQVLADLAYGVAGAQVFAFAPDQQLLDQVAGILRQLDRIVVSRKDRCLVEPKCRLQLGPVLQQLFGTVYEFPQDLTRIIHGLAEVYRRMQLRAADLKTVEERIEQVFPGHLRPAGLGWFGFQHGWLGLRRHCVIFVSCILFSGRVVIGVKYRFEGNVAGYLVFIQQLDARLYPVFLHKLFDVIGNYCGFRIRGHFQVLAFVDGGENFEVTEVQMVSVEQAPWLAFADRFAFIIDVNAVGADVDDVVNPAFAVDRSVLAGNEFVRIGEDPVIVQGPADSAAFRPELAHRIVADDLPVFADDFQFERHTRPVTSPPHANPAARSAAQHK